MTKDEIKQERIKYLAHLLSTGDANDINTRRDVIKTVTLAEGDLSCCHCGQSVYDTDDYLHEHEGNLYCWDCMEDKVYTRCAICHDLFIGAEKKEDFKLHISEEYERKYGLKAGIYRTTSWPYYRDDMFSTVVYEDSVELVRAIDINSINKKRYYQPDECLCGEICDACFDLYSLRKYKYTQYCDPKVRVTRNIYERGLIATGK
ncbi:MAG: hypothetical protein F9K23_00815 [Bacteroidetes bacterium]|nr:MAG: hypothetical protein F9K23_00815 [Bacteroidota bacterium]